MAGRAALSRLAGGLAWLYGALLLLGIAFEFLGDPVMRQLGPEADQAMRASLRAALGLDLPLTARLLGPLQELLHGRLGTSVWLRRPVWEVVAQALPVTLRLAVLAWPAGIAGGAALGLVLAAAPRGWSRLPLLLLSLPGFVVAVIAVQVVAVGLGWAPAAGIEGWRSLVLPASLLAAGLAVKLGLLLQDRLRALDSETFTVFARARALPPLRILLAYRLLPAAGLIARFGALHAGYLLGGALVMETIFALPGLGRMAVLALLNRDLPLLRGTMLAAGGAFLLARFAAETAQAWLDPRPSAAA